MASQQSLALASTLPKDLPVTFIKEITKDFSPEQELGRSVFGTVYKVRLTPTIQTSNYSIQICCTITDPWRRVGQGVLPEGGGMIAVKRLAENAAVPLGVLFASEVTNLMALQHENIVELVHYCHEAQKKVVQNNGRYVIVDMTESCLCYKYLPKGSLDNYIYGMQYIIQHLSLSLSLSTGYEQLSKQLL